jgi:hypothetical protein
MVSLVFENDGQADGTPSPEQRALIDGALSRKTGIHFC